MEEISVTKTGVFRLQSSNRKNEYLCDVIQVWQNTASHLADVAYSYEPYKWHSQHVDALYREASDFIEDRAIHSNGLLEAAGKVREAYASWDSNGRPNEPPKGEFGHSSYARFHNDSIEVVESDTGYATKLSLVPYQPEWFKLRGGEYQMEMLDAVVNGDYSLGAFEVHLGDTSSTPTLHASITKTVEQPAPPDVDTYVGVDIGENVLFSAASIGSEETATMMNGREFRHHREKLSDRIASFQEDGKLRKVKKLENERLKYTDQMTHVASRRVIDFAEQFDTPAIALENLTGYRNSDGAIHDWPFAEMQEKIVYKAREVGIPVVYVDPAYSSQTCRKCEHTRSKYRDGDGFRCGECGYEVHADVNAAFNLAKRGKQKL